ncbi:MAG TPA: DUF4129 domain-containing protein [Candidatus Polarisedimenticolia bacterium]|nr:DUF4129 domain-containing protein [Candidatus Polarisedimenticolia bacterium]
MPLERYVADLEAHAAAARTALRTREHPAREEIRRSIEQHLPESWSVIVGDGRITVNRRAIDQTLRAIEKSPETDARWWDLMVLLETMAGEGRAAMAPVAPRDDDASRRLQEILSRRQFRGLSEPGPIQRLFEKITAWIHRMLEPLGGASETPLQILGWILLAGFVVFAMVCVLRVARGRVPRSLGTVAPEKPMPNDWSSWAADAAAAARLGRYRDAVRCAYWAAILKLGVEGILDLRQERTHREYLRALPAGHPLGSDLREMTRSFERIWYGGRPATEEDLAGLLTHLRSTGVTIAWPPPTVAS